MPRSMWSGTITFGLVNIPVKLVTAVRDRSIRFHMLSQDGQCRLRQKLYCPETKKEFDFQHTARGFEVAPDQYVIIEDEEIEKVKPEAGRRIEIEEFVKLGDIDPVYYDRPYDLRPDESGAKAYALLVQAMEKAGRVGIARFVMRQKQYLAALRPVDGAILLQTMNYGDEVIDRTEIEGVPRDVKVNKKEVEVAEQLIAALAHPFKAQKYHDEYRDKLQKLIDVKSEGGDVSTLETHEEAEAPRVINLMEALQRSLKEAGSGGAKGKGKAALAATKNHRPHRRKSA
jgi:DNA end-binding protein Ku